MLGEVDYLSSGQKPLVGLDELVQDLLGDLGGRDGGGERQRLPQLLVGALDPGLDDELLDGDLLLEHALLPLRDLALADLLVAVGAHDAGDLDHGGLVEV